MKIKNMLLGIGACMVLSPLSFAEEGTEVSSINESQDTISSYLESMESTSKEEIKAIEESVTTISSEEESASESSSITEPTIKEEFLAEEVAKYISLKKDQPNIYKELDFLDLIPNTFVKGQTFFVKKEYKNTKNEIYYDLFNAQEDFVGYISGEDIQFASHPGGTYQAFNKYVSVTDKEGDILSNFEGKIKGSMNKIYRKTFIAKGTYHHFDGTLYYSIYDDKGIWQGYIEASKAEVSDDKQEGILQPLNQYVMISKKNYKTWENFEGQEKYNSTDYYERTFLVKGEYRHFNGRIYYSLYDSQDNWYGLINKSGTVPTSSAQGKYHGINDYVSVKTIIGSTWADFNWQEKIKLKDIENKTLLAKGIYHHANGQSYYSLYDKNNKWYGYLETDLVYISSGKQGKYRALNRYTTITTNKGAIWKNFEFNKKVSTSNYANKTYDAKGIYYHFNGSSYYSIYDNKGKWVGYLNSRDAKLADGPQGIYQAYGKNVIVMKKNYTIWQDFSSTKKGNSTDYINKKLIAKGKYSHFGGAIYLSLYTETGQWVGYLNENATKLYVDKMNKVQQLLNRKYSSPNFGIYVMSLNDGSTASMNGNKTFTAASTGKLPAMYYTQKMINDKKIDPNRKYLYKDAINQMPVYSYMRGGAGILQGKPFGTYYSLDTMLNWTAKYSDNQGANFLGYYGANQYELKMRNEISAIIGRQWVSPFQVTAKENAMLIAEMNKQGGQVMKYMQNTVFDDQRIPKYLPVNVAHKIGDVASYKHDVAVVYAKEPYVLSVMTQNGQSYETISILSKEIYDIMK